MNDDEKPALRERIELKKRSKIFKKSAQKHAKRVEGATVRHAQRFLINRWDKIREVRLHIIAWLGGIGILIGLVGLQMVWFQKSYLVQAPVSGGTYAEALKGSIDTLNPLFATKPAELAASHLLFSSLYANDVTGHLKGDLAASMQNEDDKIYTVKIRTDAKWHDGEKLNADDIMFTVGLMKAQAVRSVMLASWQGIAVRKIDSYTVQFILPASYAAFPQALTFAVLPEHILKDADQGSLRENAYSKNPIGSGPFVMRLLQTISTSQGRKVIHLDANRNYYAGSPRLEHIQLHTYADDESVARALRTGEVSAASNLSSDMAKSIDDTKYKAVVRPVNSGVYAMFNLSQPALKDSNVRRALQMSSDTVGIRKQLYGNPKALYSPFVDGQIDGLEEIVDPPKYDPSAAKQLLTANGWELKNGVRTKDNVELKLRVVTRKNTDYEVALRSLAGKWRELGVDVDAQVVDGSTFTQNVLRDRNYDVLIDEMVIGGDPDVFAYWHSRGRLNFTSYGNQTSDDALSSARTTSEPKLRAVKYVAFAKQWSTDIPAVGLYQSNLIYIHTPTTRAVSDREVIVTPDDHYAGVRYWTAETKNVYKTP